MGRVKRGDARRVPDGPRSAGSAWPDIDGVEAPKVPREVVLAADQEQLIRICILSAEPILPGQHAPPKRHSADRDRTTAPQGRKLLIGPAVLVSNSRVPPKKVLSEFSCLEGVDAAFVASHGRGRAVGRALRLESLPGGPAHVVPGEGFQAVRVIVAAHMPKAPRDDRDRGGGHAGTGSAAGSSAGAGIGTGSSSGAISISCSVSGAPMSIAAFLGFYESFIGNSRQKLQSEADAAPCGEAAAEAGTVEGLTTASVLRTFPPGSGSSCRLGME